MTGKEMVLVLKARTNTLDKASLIDIRPEMALLFLNQAMRELSVSKYTKDNPNDVNGYSTKQIISDQLKPLISPPVIFDMTESADKEYSVIDLASNDYFVYLYGRIKVTAESVSKKVAIHIESLDRLAVSADDPFNKPAGIHVKAIFADNKLMVVNNPDVGFSEPTLIFLRKPKTLTLDSTCELNFEDEIITRAIELVLDSTGQQSIQQKEQLETNLKYK